MGECEKFENTLCRSSSQSGQSGFVEFAPGWGILPAGIIWVQAMIKTAGEFILEAQKEIHCVDAESAKRLFDSSENAVIIDVREAGSVSESKLVDSVHISRGLLEMKVPKAIPDPDTVILTHCGGGGRASLAALTLRKMGYRNVSAITAPYRDIKKIFG